MENEHTKQVDHIQDELQTVIAEAEELLEELDIEASAHEECKPHARFYRIRVDKRYYRVSHPKVTGQEILTVAGESARRRLLCSLRSIATAIPKRSP